jgi:hypothetical protein
MSKAVHRPCYTTRFEIVTVTFQNPEAIETRAIVYWGELYPTRSSFALALVFPFCLTSRYDQRSGIDAICNYP